jgi:sulfite exporter TauE/SafE
MEIHFYIRGEATATKENARIERANSELNQAVSTYSKTAKSRAQRRLIGALAAGVSSGYLPLTTAYELLTKAHHDAK